MPNLRRLLEFLEVAPSGTLVPVDSLRALLAADADTYVDAERGFTPAEAADWLHRHLGGRKRSAAAVRKVMRTGFRGVRLRSYAYGRERRTTEADLRRFVAEIGAVPRAVSDAPGAMRAAGTAASPDARPVKSQPETLLLCPADEIAAAQERFGRACRSQSSGTPASSRRNVKGGADPMRGRSLA